MKYKIMLWWYRVGLNYTERQCEKHGVDNYIRNGYPWWVKLLGWD